MVCALERESPRERERDEEERGGRESGRLAVGGSVCQSDVSPCLVIGGGKASFPINT